MCCFKDNHYNLTGAIRSPIKPLVGPKLRAGSGKPPQKPPCHGGNNDHGSNMDGHAHYVWGDYHLTWKGQVLLAFAAASLFLGLHKAHDAEQGLEDFKEDIVNVCKTHTGGTNDLPTLNP